MGKINQPLHSTLPSAIKHIPFHFHFTLLSSLPPS
jgi:hypothetical protein